MKQEDNVLGSVRPFVCLSELSCLNCFIFDVDFGIVVGLDLVWGIVVDSRGSALSKVFVCVSVIRERMP